MIKTIIGKLHSNSICKIKNKKWHGYVMPVKNDIFQKLDSFKLEKKIKKIY